MNTESTRLLLEQVQQIRQLLELLAEPAIAQRDAKLRSQLREIVGSSPKKQQAVFHMDGTLTQREIVSQTSVNQGHLSTMVGKLDKAGLLADGKKQPKLVISIPTNFFDSNE
jgi:CRP-like cAMP-binding protein